MNRSCNAKEKTRHAANELSALDTVLGRPLFDQSRERALRRAGLTPLHRCDMSSVQTQLNRIGSNLK